MPLLKPIHLALHRKWLRFHGSELMAKSLVVSRGTLMIALAGLMKPSASMGLRIAIQWPSFLQTIEAVLATRHQSI
jgi:hypothetical protein